LTITTSCLAPGLTKLLQQRPRESPSLSYPYFNCILILVATVLRSTEGPLADPLAGFSTPSCTARHVVSPNSADSMAGFATPVAGDVGPIDLVSLAQPTMPADQAGAANALELASLLP
jgi:hypothetical protein